MVQKRNGNCVIEDVACYVSGWLDDLPEKHAPFYTARMFIGTMRAMVRDVACYVSAAGRLYEIVPENAPCIPARECSVICVDVRDVACCVSAAGNVCAIVPEERTMFYDPIGWRGRRNPEFRARQMRRFMIPRTACPEIVCAGLSRKQVVPVFGRCRHVPCEFCGVRITRS